MKLTDPEKKMLDGPCATRLRQGLRLLVTLGEVYGPGRMVPLSSAGWGAAAT
jgi:predicted aconitase